MTLSENQCEFLTAVSKLILWANSQKISLKVSEWLRTVETQKQYMADGKSKTMDSKHLNGLAVDLAIIRDGKAICAGEEFRPLGVFWESLGGRWGGRFGLEDKSIEVQAKELGWDSDHFEWRTK